MCQAPPATPSKYTREERGAMLAQADRSIGKVVLRMFPLHHFDDVMQDVRIEVLKAMDKFDPARGAAWVTYATGIAKRAILRIRESQFITEPVAAALLRNPHGFDITFEEMASGYPSPDASVLGPDADAGELDDEDGDEAHRAVRAAVAEPLLANLSPAARAIVEPIVLDGMTPAQVADRIGRSVKDVKLMLRNATKTLAAGNPAVQRALGSEWKPQRPRKSSGRARAVTRSKKCDELEPVAIAALQEFGPVMRPIAERIGVGKDTLASWPRFREAYDRMAAEFPSVKAFQLQAKAIEVLKDCGPILHRIAKQVGVSGITLLRWPGFRAAFELAQATSTVEEPRPEPIPAAFPIAPSPSPRSGHGWHFGKRLAPWTARTLGQRGRRAGKR
ncbi:sigma-70 family RNA polymerase sigma factor [Limnoglobus roseus]|uniref:Sigma-70 family RNA polymerase sigma factor n=1 Tax=Limnoglobus roseus TaxID=2598579 RepID=A0A5C1A8P9_9BACT|nr:sigma-70 family RNA polymerase sigma factor [Limnoglobus roseus]QEL14142.1 sigma-70 family RNA polymerase sigma factor [Limnoglobus roseus]